MKVINSISGKIVQGLDVANTIGGGMSMATFHWTDNENESILQVKTPGLDASNYYIDLKNNILHLYSNFVSTENGENTNTPYLMRYFHLPYYIDLDNVIAEFENGTLQVILPYNESQKGFEKNIEIH